MTRTTTFGPHATSVGQLTAGELTVRLTEQVSRLAREEARAAVEELRGKGKRAKLGAGMFGFAGVLALIGGGAVVAGLVLLLSLVMYAWLAAIVVGVVVLVVAGIAAIVGRAQLRRVGSPIPERTAASIAQDARAIRRGLTP